MPFCLCHGDFKYAQVFFDGDAVGLVDLDNVCQAEPALDLGQFFAYLRTQARKNPRAESVSAAARISAITSSRLSSATR